MRGGIENARPNQAPAIRPKPVQTGSKSPPGPRKTQIGRRPHQCLFEGGLFAGSQRIREARKENIPDVGARIGATPPDIPDLLRKSNALERESVERYPHLCDEGAKIAARASYMVREAEISGYKARLERKMVLFLSGNGGNWRDHRAQAIRYEDGCWKAIPRLSIGFAHLLTSIEGGLLIRVAQRAMRWSWNEVGHIVDAALIGCVDGSEIPRILRMRDKSHSDHTRSNT